MVPIVDGVRLCVPGIVKKTLPLRCMFGLSLFGHGCGMHHRSENMSWISTQYLSNCLTILQRSAWHSNHSFACFFCCSISTCCHDIFGFQTHLRYFPVLPCDIVWIPSDQHNYDIGDIGIFWFHGFPGLLQAFVALACWASPWSQRPRNLTGAMRAIWVGNVLRDRPFLMILFTMTNDDQRL